MRGTNAPARSWRTEGRPLSKKGTFPPTGGKVLLVAHASLARAAQAWSGVGLYGLRRRRIAPVPSAARPAVGRRARLPAKNRRLTRSLRRQRGSRTAGAGAGRRRTSPYAPGPGHAEADSGLWSGSFSPCSFCSRWIKIQRRRTADRDPPQARQGGGAAGSGWTVIPATASHRSGWRLSCRRPRRCTRYHRWRWPGRVTASPRCWR